MILKKVVFAGGRVKFFPTDVEDLKLKKKYGDRIDNRNLVNEWQEKMKNASLKHIYIDSYDGFKNLKATDGYQYVLGLLSYSHMQYENERKAKTPIEEPSITEMTEKAIEILSLNPNGYFLLVEGGKIDVAHHDNLAKLALDDFVAFDNAVGKAQAITSSKDTLITVTADHSHV